jgi:hypothetical protein
MPPANHARRAAHITRSFARAARSTIARPPRNDDPASDGALPLEYWEAVLRDPRVAGKNHGCRSTSGGSRRFRASVFLLMVDGSDSFGCRIFGRLPVRIVRKRGDMHPLERAPQHHANRPMGWVRKGAEPMCISFSGGDRRQRPSSAPRLPWRGSNPACMTWVCPSPRSRKASWCPSSKSWLGSALTIKTSTTCVPT